MIDLATIRTYKDDQRVPLLECPHLRSVFSEDEIDYTGDLNFYGLIDDEIETED